MEKEDGQAPEKRGRESADIDDLLAGEEQERQKKQKMDREAKKRELEDPLERYLRISREQVKIMRDMYAEPDNLKRFEAGIRSGLVYIGDSAPEFSCFKTRKSKLYGAAPSDVHEKNKKGDMPDSKDAQEGAGADKKN